MSETFTGAAHGSGTTRRVAPNAPTFGNRKPEPPTRSARCLRHRGSTRRTGTPPPRRTQMSETFTKTRLVSGATRRVAPKTPSFGNRRPEPRSIRARWSPHRGSAEAPKPRAQPRPNVGELDRNGLRELCHTAGRVNDSDIWQQNTGTTHPQCAPWWNRLGRHRRGGAGVRHRHRRREPLRRPGFRRQSLAPRVRR